MPGIPGAEAELAAIHAAFAAPVTYTGAGLTDETVSAVRSDDPAGAFQGPGETLRSTSFEIPFSEFPDGEEPANGDTIVEADETSWEVIDATRRPENEAWVLFVEISE